MSTVAERIAAVRERIAVACARCGRDPAAVGLLAVSKTRAPAELRAALAAGQVDFGENRVQELVPKAAELADAAARWHFIGSLQTNKVGPLLGVSNLDLVHSVDRLKLVDKLAELTAQRRPGHPLAVLLQVDATFEARKHGVEPGAAAELARAVLAAAPALRLDGLMAMGPLAGDPAAVFAAVARLRAELCDDLGVPLPTLSLGMTADLEAAIAAGSTLVRVGTGVFGPRAGR